MKSVDDRKSDIDETSIKKKGCQWIFTSHDLVETKEVISSLKSVNGNAVFKFEPFVLHAQCRNLTDARTLLSCALASGFRNSGISIGNKGKFITCAGRSGSMLFVLLITNCIDPDLRVALCNGRSGSMQFSLDSSYNHEGVPTCACSALTLYAPSASLSVQNTAVRSTHSLEAPLTCDGKLMVSEEYIEYLVKLANIKMKENFIRIERLFTNMKESLTGDNCDHRKKKHIKEKEHMKRKVNIEKSQLQENEKVTEMEVTDNEDLSVCNLFQSDFVT